MGWFKTSDGGKAKVTRGQDGSMKHEKISKPTKGGRHSHSIQKTDVSGKSTFTFFGGHSSGKSRRK